MAFPSVELEIDGNTFKVQALTYELANEKWIELVAIIGDSIGSLVATLAPLAADGASPKDVDVNALAGILPKLAEKMGGGRFVKMQKTFLSQSFINGQPLVANWDVALAGRMEVGWQLFGAALKLNYAKVFTVLLANALSAWKQKASAKNSDSPTT